MENTNYRRGKPMTTNKWIGILLLLTVPLVNIYFIIYWAFIQKVSMTRRNFSRALIIWSIIVALITILLLIIIQPDLQSFATAFKNMKSTNVVNFVE